MSATRAQAMLQAIRRTCEGLGELRFMEVCGTHTVSLFRSGVRSVLPVNLTLRSGPGCPVCVTAQGYVDAAIRAALEPGITLCTYGDMLRVPGRLGSLEQHRGRGAKLVVCYSVLDGLRHARAHPGEEVVFAAVGFETTAPATALAVLEAERMGIENFSILNGHKRVVPALRALLTAGEISLDGFLLPGHVSVIIGSEAYRELVDVFGMACVVAGFEPDQLLRGILALVEQAARKLPCLENVYAVAVRPEGNVHALACLDRVFQPVDASWRGMGTFPASGYALRPRFERFDATVRLGLVQGEDYDPPGCRCGEVIQGKADPVECSLFGEVCTFESPVGPCMVSSEGTCAAWFRYGRPQG